MISKELLEILCCPQCRGDLHYEQEKEILTCINCGKVYKIKDNIPIMMLDDGDGK